MDEHQRFMTLAIEEARGAASAGSLAVGAVIVRDGEVLGAGRNLVAVQGDPTAHAEIVAIRDAARRLGATQFDGATLYTTTEPCPMCLWAICTTGIGELVLGARHAAFVRPELGDYSVERMLKLTGASLGLVTGVLADECASLRSDLRRRD